MNKKPTSRFKLTNLILPGLNHLIAGYTLKGIIFSALAIGVAVGAFYMNQYFFLKYLWKLKTMLLPHTLIQEFYTTKQTTAYNFVYIYLIIGTGAFFDFALLAKPVANNNPGGKSGS